MDYSQCSVSKPEWNQLATPRRGKKEIDRGGAGHMGWAEAAGTRPALCFRGAILDNTTKLPESDFWKLIFWAYLHCITTMNSKFNLPSPGLP